MSFWVQASPVVSSPPAATDRVLANLVGASRPRPVDDPAFSATVDDSAPGTTVVALRGDVDLETRQPLRRVLDRAAGRGGTLVIDLAGVGFFGAAGLSAIVEVHHHRGPAAAPIVVRSPRRLACRLLGLSDVVRLVTVELTLAPAVPA